MRDKHEVVALQVTNMVLTQVYLETEIAYATLEQAVHEWAYQEGRMARDGDVLIVPIPPAEITTTPMVVETPMVEVVSPWRVWWALFFDR